MENHQGQEHMKSKSLYFFPSMNQNWIPLATVLNCAEDERLKRIGYQSVQFFLEVEGPGRRQTTRGQRVICNHALSSSFWHRLESGV